MHEAVARTRRGGDARDSNAAAEGEAIRDDGAPGDDTAVRHETVGAPSGRRAGSDQRLARDVDRRGEGPLYREVDSAVRARLAELAEVTRFADDAALAAVARVELPKLADTLAQLLSEHHPDDRGRCRACKQAWYRRGAPAPCRAYLSAYLGLLAADGDGNG